MDADSDISHVFSEYFCIFCDDNFATIHEAYEHYKCHMNIATFCKVCDTSLNRNCSQDSEECDVDHEAENVHLESEQSVIEMWIERLLTYQEELIDKPFYNIITGHKFFLGCPVCDHLIKMCNVKVPADITQKYKSMENANAVDVSPNSSNKESVKCHTARHACAHLRYYPYECYACEKIGRYQKKPDISEMLRHIKDAHGKDVRFRENWESIIKHVTITKVEKFMDYYLKSRPMLRFDPILPSKPLSPKNVPCEKQVRKEGAVSNELKLAKIKITSTAPSSPDSTSSGSKVNHILSNVSPKEQKSMETVVYKFSSQNLQKSIDTPEKNLQFTITRNKNSLGNNLLESNQSSFQRHFGNIFDDEDMIKLAINQEEDANTEYFCIFCDSVFKEKDEARRHYQQHVNYYPMMCSLCGEGATDMQEFLKHHTEVHPDAEKGRYKRREQPLVDKWINGFLYAQATVIRAFPAREQCPVCEKVFTAEQIKAARPRRCTVNRKIDHVHRHLCYLPYECVKCKEEGKEFVVAYFESKAHSHIKLKHPEIDDTESRWFVFQKTISIPKLDEYVADFFTKFGISMEFERRPVKKQCRETFSSPDFMTAYSGSSTQIALGDSLINQTEKCVSNSGTMIIISQSQTEKESFGAKNNDGVVILEEGVEDDLATFIQEPESMVIALSPSHVDYLKFRENSVNTEYFCIFCSLKFSAKFDAYPHFGEHLDYKPVVCLLCESRFHDINEITIHHQLSHQETVDLLYEIREDQNVEKWVDDFLDSQQKKLIQQVLTCSCSAFCPVCEKMQSDVSLPQCVTHSDVEFSEHIHRHLSYFTYECALCKKFGRTTRVSNLDSSAVNHLQEQHMMSNANTYQLSKTFPKTLAIPKIEKLISQSLQKKCSLDRKCKVSRTENQSIVICGVTSNGVSDSLLPNIAQSPAVPHIRVQDGRVVNLPSSISIRAIHNKRNFDLSNHLFTGDTQKGDAVPMGTLKFYVKCLHCNRELPSRKQLKMHHQQEHPGLSMACFTTPKSMLSLGSN
ncbi:hypothetical protein B4U80_12698 [Leptotrombidium deliense]|uniref:C2H2-type domain-containing protein n=1 Tax=Leptotrombidium deliense TaxID=299467 RepID=A0A443SQD5_9ACAR|nr:hypothetical protein B4U80_12698 [Leptotrombidium deliense]